MNDIERKSIELAAQSGEAYPVDFDQAWQWIGYARKDAALRALKASFQEGYHFHTTVEMVQRAQGGGARAAVVKLTKDCFKHFCMMAMTDKGREVRQYFIQCEEKLHEVGQYYIPRTYVEALRLAADQTEKLDAANRLLEEQRPAVEYVQRYVGAKGSISFRKAAAVLGIPERDFIAEMIRRKLIYRTASDNGSLCAYSEYLRSGLFVEKTGTSEKGHVYTQTRITSHGMTYLARLFGGAA